MSRLIIMLDNNNNLGDFIKLNYDWKRTFFWLGNLAVLLTNIRRCVSPPRLRLTGLPDSYCHRYFWLLYVL